MGAEHFVQYVARKGRTVEKAFSDTVQEASARYGNSGYSGTIAEKYKFTMMTVPEGMTARGFIDRLENENLGLVKREDDSAFNPYDDKWGPAGCVVDGDEWIFFGAASS